MRNSVVSIESVSNNSFGTGFVIDSDEKGIYVLTCQHVLDDVETPVVENVLAKVIAKGGFIDMALLYVSKLHLEPLPLQEKECNQLDVEVIGFSHFNQSLTQKKHIKATLYQELIELHSKEEDTYYNVRKIKANDGFNFDRGNSGSPVICKHSGNVIAMVSNKEGNNIAYAIDIENLKTVWKDVPKELFKVAKRPEILIEEVSGVKESPTIVEPIKIIEEIEDKSKSSFSKYMLIAFILMALGFGVFNLREETSSSDYNPTPTVKTSSNSPTIDFSQKKFLNLHNDHINLSLYYPVNVKRGAKVYIDAILKNNGEYASQGGITLSFPQFIYTIGSEVKSNNFSEGVKTFNRSSKIWNIAIKKSFNSLYPMIEGSDEKWTQGEEHSFRIAIETPEDTTTFEIWARATLRERVVPQSGPQDQQGYAAEVITINIID